MPTKRRVRACRCMDEPLCHMCMARHLRRAGVRGKNGRPRRRPWSRHIFNLYLALGAMTVQQTFATLGRSMHEMRMTVFGWVVPRWQEYVDYLVAVRKAAQLVEGQRRRDAELEAEMQSRAQELAQRIAHAERLAAAEKMSVEEERAKYRALHEQLAHKALDQEGEARKRHDELMGKLVLEREKQLAEMDAAWRKNVAKSEMSHLRDETAAYREAAEAREERARGAPR